MVSTMHMNILKMIKSISKIKYIKRLNSIYFGFQTDFKIPPIAFVLLLLGVLTYIQLRL